MDRKINLGGSKFKMETVGVDEALEKLNLLMLKLTEANSLINELASIGVNIKLNDIVND